MEGKGGFCIWGVCTRIGMAAMARAGVRGGRDELDGWFPLWRECGGARDVVCDSGCCGDDVWAVQWCLSDWVGLGVQQCVVEPTGWVFHHSSVAGGRRGGERGWR